MALDDDTKLDLADSGSAHTGLSLILLEGTATPAEQHAGTKLSREDVARVVSLPAKPNMQQLTVPLRLALYHLDSATDFVDDDPKAFEQAQLVIGGVYAAIKRLLEQQPRLTLPDVRWVIAIAAQAIARILADTFEKDSSLRVRIQRPRRPAPRISNLA